MKARRADEPDEALFDVVGHLNRGAALLRSQAERDELAALNLRAGRKAKAAAAFQSAAALFTAGLSCSRRPPWEAQHELTYDLTLERAHAAYITGGFDEAERLLEELMERARTRTETAAAVELIVTLQLIRGQTARAVEIGSRGSAPGTSTLPRLPTDTQLEEETKGVWQALGDRAIEDLIHLPSMTDREVKLTMGVLERAGIAASFMDPEPPLSHLPAHGPAQPAPRQRRELRCSRTPPFARMFGPRFGRYQEAYRFGKLGHDLAHRSGLLTTKAMVFATFGHHIVFWTRHYRETYPVRTRRLQRRARGRRLSDGVLQLHVGRAVPRCSPARRSRTCSTRSTTASASCAGAGYAFAHGALLSAHAMIQALRGRPVRFAMFDGAELDPPAFEARLQEGELRPRADSITA